MNRTTWVSTFLLATCTMAASTVLAQDTGESPADFEPAVDTSADLFDAEPAVDTSAASAAEAEAEEDVRRRVTTTGVMDEMDLGTTEVTGNQELPKVMYIVPWQKTDPGEFMGQPINSLLDEVLAPVNRDEFVRQVDYYRDLNGEP